MSSTMNPAPLELASQLLAELQQVRGLVAVKPFELADLPEILRIEKEAEEKSLLGLGRVTNTGIQAVACCRLIYTALTSMDFDWTFHGSLLLKKGDEIVGEEVRDPVRLEQLQGRKDVWFMHRNFVVYKHKLRFPQDIMQKICHFEIPPIPCNWPVVTCLPAGYRLILANPSTPGDVFLKKKYFQGWDERGLGTILIGLVEGQDNKSSD